MSSIDEYVKQAAAQQQYVRSKMSEPGFEYLGSGNALGCDADVRTPRALDALGTDLDMLMSRSENIRLRVADIRSRVLGAWPEPGAEPKSGCAINMSALDRLAAVVREIEGSLNATADHLTALERL